MKSCTHRVTPKNHRKKELERERNVCSDAGMQEVKGKTKVEVTNIGMTTAGHIVCNAHCILFVNLQHKKI